MVHRTRDACRARGGEAGYALLVTLLAIIGLTVLATGGFLISNSESNMSRNYRHAVGGFNLAEAGLSSYLGTMDGTPPDDTVTYTFSEGTADVWATELGDSGDGHRIWQITSRSTPSAPYEALRRQVSTLVMVDPVISESPAAFISADTLEKSGSAGNISGDDESTSDDCPEGAQGSRAGLWSYWFEGNLTAASGSPDTIRTKVDPSVNEADSTDVVTNPYDSIATATGWSIDWQGILDGTEVAYDYIVSDPSNFPDLSDTTEWAVVKIDQSGSSTNKPMNQVTIDDACCSGQGLLVVEQAVKFSGDFTWDGIIMSGGAIRSSGTTDIQGTLLTGLATTLYPFSLLDMDKSSIGSGTKNFQYNACTVAKAGREAGKLVQIPNSWFESFSF